MIFKTFLTSIASLVALFFLTKMIGNRQMSQLNMFEYINGITIGSIAAEMATSLETNPFQPLTAMATYAVFVTLISHIACKFISVRPFFLGKPLILFENGKLIEDNFKKTKLDLNEFIMECRNNGYFEISSLQTIIMEANGKLSFLPLAGGRPLTPADMNISPIQERLVLNLIIDGKILYDNLQFTGNNEQWLKDQVSTKTQGKSISDVFLATCNAGNQVNIYLKNEQL